MPTLLASRAAVTVEKLDAGPAPGHADLQSTRENILAGILRTPTVWMDFDAIVDRELDLTTPEPHRVAGAAAVENGNRFGQRAGVRRTGIQAGAPHRITRRSARRD